MDGYRIEYLVFRKRPSGGTGSIPRQHRHSPASMLKSTMQSLPLRINSFRFLYRLINNFVAMVLLLGSSRTWFEKLYRLVS